MSTDSVVDVVVVVVVVVVCVVAVDVDAHIRMKAVLKKNLERRKKNFLKKRVEGSLSSHSAAAARFRF